MGWLERWDKRNQSVANYLMDHPEAGTQFDPFAKSPRSRRILLWAMIAILVVTYLAWTFGGALIGVVVFIIGLVAMKVLSRRHEVHPGRDGYERHRPSGTGSD